MDTTREIVTDALRYWEGRRLVYNAVLLAITAVGYALAPAAGGVGIDHLALLFVCAILANVLYCAAYPIDLFVQFSDFRDAWRRRRVLLFGAGTAFAALLALPSAIALFAPVTLD